MLNFSQLAFLLRKNRPIRSVVYGGIMLPGKKGSFSGIYTQNGKQGKWTGERINKELFDHQLAVDLITLRNAPLTSAQYADMRAGNYKLNADTNIGFLTRGDLVKKLSKENQSYKVILKAKGILKMGYIATAIAGENTLGN